MKKCIKTTSGKHIFKEERIRVVKFEDHSTSSFFGLCNTLTGERTAEYAPVCNLCGFVDDRDIRIKKDIVWG